MLHVLSNLFVGQITIINYLESCSGTVLTNKVMISRLYIVFALFKWLKSLCLNLSEVNSSR